MYNIKEVARHFLYFNSDVYNYQKIMNHELHKFLLIRIAVIRVNSYNSWLKNSFIC